MEILIILILVTVVIVVVITTNNKKKKNVEGERKPSNNYSSANIRPVNTKQVVSKLQPTEPLNTTQTNHISSNQVTTSNLPNINYSSEIFVDYDAKKWESTNLSFPYVKVPNKFTTIKYPVEGKNSRRGIIEDSFFRDFLSLYFKGLIYDNLSIFMGVTPYEPDIALIDLSKNLFIDIEIDEPYDGVNRNPIHYVENGKLIDESRDKGFTDRGWLVIHFSEKQIKEQPIQCCKSICEIIKTIKNEYISDLDKVVTIVKEKMWTKEEATQMAKDKVREKYLGISQFSQSETPRNYSIKDYAGAEKIENKLLSQQKKQDVNAPFPIPKPQEHRISTQPTSQPSIPAPRPYAL